MITGEVANARVQVLRSMHDAIMVGVGTALVDDPLLTVRLPGNAAKPLRVVLDTHLRLPAVVAARGDGAQHIRRWSSRQRTLRPTGRRCWKRAASR